MTAKHFLGLFVLIASGTGFSTYGQIFLEESAVLFVCTGVAYVFMRGLLGVRAVPAIKKRWNELLAAIRERK